ncbi:bacteriorhodopsin [Xylariaceae sp. FL0255]|nr:bacteriorhodopsin [Xylariaceae sp. FL0255]
MSGNQALNINRVVGQHADLQINNRGSDWYYTVCGIMGASTLIIMAFALRRHQSHRIFHYITAAITATAAIAYWAMGSNVGQVPIQVEFVRPGSSQVRSAGTREIFYARYIDWAITTPLLLLDLLLTAGVPWPTIAATLFADEIMIVCGLIGALTQTSYKWGFWTIGMFALFFIAYQLLFDGRRHANVLGGAPKRTYWTCGVWLISIWFLYPIAWGLSEGGNVIHPDAEAIFYGILDIASKPVFGLILLLGHRNINPAVLGIRTHLPTEASEKYGHASGANGVHPEGPGSNVGGNMGQTTGQVPGQTTDSSNLAGAGHPTAAPQNV